MVFKQIWYLQNKLSETGTIFKQTMPNLLSNDEITRFDGTLHPYLVIPHPYLATPHPYLTTPHPYLTTPHPY